MDFEIYLLVRAALGEPAQKISADMSTKGGGVFSETTRFKKLIIVCIKNNIFALMSVKA